MNDKPCDVAWKDPDGTHTHYCTQTGEHDCHCLICGPDCTPEMMGSDMNDLLPLDPATVAEGDVIQIEGRGKFKVTEVCDNEDGTKTVTAVVHPPLFDDEVYSLYRPE